MNQVNGLAQHQYLLAQWFECSIDIWGVVDSNTVGDSGFTLSHARNMLDICLLE